VPAYRRDVGRDGDLSQNRIRRKACDAMVLAFIMAMVQPTLASLKFVGPEIKFNELWALLLTTGTIMLFTWTAPSLAASLLAGSPSLSAGGVAQNMMSGAMMVSGIGGLATTLARGGRVREQLVRFSRSDRQSAGEVYSSLPTKHADAATYFRKSLAIYERDQGPSGDAVKRVVSMLAELLRGDKKDAEALELEEHYAISAKK
jgi:hypothetical protein